MKLRKALSGLMFGFGCAISFVGTLALVLPCVSNSQLQLVLQSFEMPSSHTLVHWMNTAMSFALHHAWQVLGIGLLCAVIGGILLALCSQTPRAPIVQEEVFRRPAPVEIPVQPVKVQPAHNPFAEITYDQLPKPAPSPAVQHVLHHEPLLEPNRIEENTPAAPAMPAVPVCPPAPVLAGAPSQSGSRIITRTVLTHPEAIASPTEETAEPAVSESVVTQPIESLPAAAPQPVSRIRSTMGKHRKW